MPKIMVWSTFFVVFSCVNFGMISGQNILASFFDNDVKPCIAEESITLEKHSDDFVKLILTTIKDNSTFSSVMSCVELRISLNEEGFLYDTFELNAIDDIASIVSSIYKTSPAKDWDCLVGRLGQSPCIDLAALGYSPGLSKCGVYKTVPTVCKDVISSFGCGGYVNMVIQQFVNIMFGKCLFNSVTSTDAVPTEAPTPEATDLYTDFMSTAFLQCVNDVYGQMDDTFQYLFPPAHLTKSYLLMLKQQNKDIVAENRAATDIFCMNVTQYSRCVEQKLLQPGNPVDDRLVPYINVGGLDMQMTRFCDMRDMVSSQFLCTLDSLGPDSCGMGLLDLLVQAARTPFQQDQYGQRCGDIRNAIRCRVDQLTACSDEYGSKMNVFLNGLLRDGCTGGAIYQADDQITTMAMANTAGTGGPGANAQNRNTNSADIIKATVHLFIVVVAKTIL